MASDVLKRAEGVRTYCCGSNKTSPCIKCATIDALAAEVRELRAKVDMQSKLLQRWDGVYGSCYCHPSMDEPCLHHATLIAVDAAMAEAKERTDGE